MGQGQSSSGLTAHQKLRAPSVIRAARAVARPIGTVADEHVRLLHASGWTAEQFRREARELRARSKDGLADRLEYEATCMESAR